MNYKKHYENLIERAKNRVLNCYTESHHIVPRSLGGGDNKDNLVDLTAREHFIAHLLLVKIYSNNYNMIKAVNMMCIEKNAYSNRSMNRMYGWLREKFSKDMSKSQSGDGNSQFGTKWIHNLNLKKSKKISKNHVIPEGWLLGRKIKFDVSENLVKCKCCKNETPNKVFCSNECRIKYNKLHKKEKIILTKSEIGKRISEGRSKSQKAKDSQKGELNSQFGSTFIHNKILKEQKRVKKNDLEMWLEQGWEIGQLYIKCSCGKDIPKMRLSVHKKNCK